MRPPMPSMALSRRAKISVGVVVALIVLLILAVKFSGVYINYLWFDQTGHHNVYNTVFWTRVTLFFVFGVLMALILGGNVAVAYLVRPPFRPMSPEQQNLQHYVGVLEPRRKLILTVVSLIALLSAGAAAQGDWAKWQLWLHGTSFGVKDPQFHRDISFYAFDYPVYRAMLGFGFAAVIFALILSAGVHYLTGSIRLQTPGPKITTAARRHLTILVFVFMLLKAVAYWFDRYGLVFSTRSRFTGASYTDVHSELPAKTILFWISIVLAVAVLASIWLRSVLLPGIGFVALLVVSILIGGIYPAIVQQVSVKPNASDKERTYILRNIDSTRAAYNIAIQNPGDDSSGAGAKANAGADAPVQIQKYAVDSSPEKSALTTSSTTVDNIRITDPNVVSSIFTNKQKIGQYYSFTDPLNVDRYTGTDPTSNAKVVHDYIVGARELSPANLDASKRNWINEHTVYTHGYGIVAARASADITAPNATFSAGNIPTSPTTGPLAVKVPQIYYGQEMADFSIVGAQGKAREYDGDSNIRDTYKGKGGISLSSGLTKLALTLHYKDTNFLLNDAVGSKGAKMIFVRDPKARVEKLAPFLTVDGDPFPFVDQQTGHVTWMVDGYTTMANYPYSERQSLSSLTHTSLRQGQRDTQINYIRNSVKATVDAYDGTVHLYQWDSSDALLRAYMKVFPGLVQPRSDMPSAVLSHVRYPQDLFDVQRGLLAQYHVSDPVAFYNGSDQWSVPSDANDPGAGDQPPYYVLANSPDTKSNTAPEFQLTSPMLVNSGKNLAAYLSANCGPDDYGRLSVLEVNDTGAVQGPEQAASQLKQTFASEIRQINQGGSESTLKYGNLLTLPLGGSFLYVEPLYTSTSSAFPKLQYILASYGGQYGIGRSLTEALNNVSPDNGTGSGSTDNGGGSGTTSTSPSPDPSGSTSAAPTESASVQSLVTRLASVNSQLAAARKAGDFDQYSALLTEKNDLTDQLVKALQATGSGTPSSSPSGGSTATPRR